jgi:hypothetical protein
VHGSLQGQVNQSGAYSLMLSDDAKEPDISITVEDQGFADGDYITDHPTLAVVIRDINGVLPDSIRVYLDEDTVVASEYAVTFPPENRDLCLLSFKPFLAAGQHTFKVRACDNVLNIGEATVSFAVAEAFTLRFVANHPNPFWKETYIAYTVTGLADEVIMKIYTAGGRLIRTYRQYGVIGYSEQKWEGRDEDEQLVANGVYYLKVMAKSNGTTVVKKTKMAFMRR